MLLASKQGIETSSSVASAGIAASTVNLPAGFHKLRHGQDRTALGRRVYFQTAFPFITRLHVVTLAMRRNLPVSKRSAVDCPTDSALHPCLRKVLFSIDSPVDFPPFSASIFCMLHVLFSDITPSYIRTHAHTFVRTYVRTYIFWKITGCGRNLHEFTHIIRFSVE